MDLHAPSRSASPRLVGGPPRYEEQQPLPIWSTCSDVIGSKSQIFVTGITVRWVRYIRYVRVRQIHSPYWQPRYVRGFLSLFVYRRAPNRRRAPCVGQSVTTRLTRCVVTSPGRWFESPAVGALTRSARCLICVLG